MHKISGGAAHRAIMDAKTLTALFSPARRRIFCALFLKSERWWTLPELAGRTGLRQATLDQQVAWLRNGGIVRAKTVAGQTLIRPDPASRIFAELNSIVKKLATSASGAPETILVVEDQEATLRASC
ncbi:MAG TPA: winged helix-turn-helix domain-containing protein [Bryobacteraceae bacterium]|nr:winged helix-turn-helix domain-containing protein [Bryobacteraceae bacterium]